MVKFRTGRVGEQIKKEISRILQTEFKDPRIGFVTVTGVEVTNDLSQATVYLSVLGSPEQKEESLRALSKGMGFLRSEVGKRVRLRHTPELMFKFDTSIEYGSKIDHLLKQIQNEEHGK
ncbi:MAG TPA: 30S ribosome-binding factor RbfA [Bacilli bacterium]